jgi:hypothetical protein
VHRCVVCQELEAGLDAVRIEFSVVSMTVYNARVHLLSPNLRECDYRGIVAVSNILGRKVGKCAVAVRSAPFQEQLKGLYTR